MQKLDATGAVVLNVEYDPFGNVIAIKDANGNLSTTLEFVGEYGFSTKPLIDDLDWYYYGFRYYDSVTGRWPSRDPIGERGGLNLYGFVYNEPIYHIDILGQAPVIPVILSALKDCAINLALQKLKSSVANATVTQWLKTMCASNNVGSPNHKNITVPKSVFNPSRDMPNYRSAVFSCARNLVTKGVFNTYVNNKFPNVGNIEDKLTQKVLNDINKLTDQTIQKLEDGAKLEWGTAKITTSKNPDNCCSLDWEIEGHVKTGLGNNLSQISIGVLISDTVTASSSSSSLGSACGLCK